jgi:hypothetical protein
MLIPRGLARPRREVIAMDVTRGRIGRLTLVAAVLLAAACGGSTSEDRPPGDAGTTTVADAPTTSPTPTAAGSEDTTPPVSGLVDPLPTATAIGAVTCDGCPEITDGSPPRRATGSST